MREFLPTSYYCNVDFVRLFPVRSDHRLLDVGCGAGRHTAEAAKHVDHVVAMDIDPANLRATAELLKDRVDAGQPVSRVDFVLADAQHLPFKTGTFNRVLCTEVMEHVPDDALAIREMRRLLKPEGLAVISAPAFIPEWLFWRLARAYPARAQGHIRIYPPGGLLGRVRNAGFTPYAVRGRHAHQSLLWLFACLTGLPTVENGFVHLLRSFLHYQEFRSDKDRTAWRLEAIANFLVPKDRIVYARR